MEVLAPSKLARERVTSEVDDRRRLELEKLERSMARAVMTVVLEVEGGSLKDVDAPSRVWMVRRSWGVVVLAEVFIVLESGLVGGWGWGCC